MTRGTEKSFRKKFTSMLNDSSSPYSATTMPPSEIPQLDRLIEHLEDRTDTSYLLPLFEELDQVLGSLYTIYLNELSFLADGEPQNVAANQIARDFSSLRPIVAQLRNELALAELEGSLETAHELRVAVAKLFTSFGDLKAQAQTGPRYSEIPFTQELLRVIYHYLDGNLPHSAVQERLDAFCNYHDNLEISLEQMIPSDAERTVLQAHQEDLEEALALQLQGIEDLDVALERRSDKGVRKAAETLKAASETLFEIYEELNRAEMGEPATVSCFRCGANSPIDSRLCSGCGAVLPRFDAGASGAKPSSRIEIQENSSAASAKPTELITLEHAVEEALHTQDPTALVATIDAFGARLKGVRQRAATLKEAPNDIPAEHLEMLQEGRTRFQESLALIGSGYELLKEAAPLVDEALLRRGLDDIESGYSLMQGFGEVFERAEQLSKT